MDYLQINELYHWGVKGMKWGIRRYTNEDGSLTKEGQTRYNEIDEEKKTSDLYDKMVSKSAHKYYDWVDNGRDYDDLDPKSKKKVDRMYNEYRNDFNKFADVRDKMIGKHEDAQKMIDAGETYYKDLDPEILNQIIDEDNKQIEETNRKIQAEIDRKKTMTANALGTAVIAGVLGAGAYLNFKKKKNK